MLAAIAPYLVAFSAMAFAALSALTLIHSVNRWDPPGAEGPTERGTAPRVAEEPHEVVAA